MVEFATDRTLALVGGFRPGGGNVEIAVGIGYVDGSRYRDPGHSGENLVDRVDVGGTAVFAQLGWAPRRRVGLGVRAMAVMSRPLSGVGAALTVGLH